MGASNELPESEELDALFDRFLVRRQVAQASALSAVETYKAILLTGDQCLRCTSSYPQNLLLLHGLAAQWQLV